MKNKIYKLICVILLIAAAAGSLISIGKSYQAYRSFYIKKQYFGVDTVWNEAEKDRAESYLYSVIKEKECAINPDMWYSKYFEAMAGSVVYDPSLKEYYRQDEIDVQNYTRVGNQCVYIYYTLVAPVLKESFYAGKDMDLYIDFRGLEHTDSLKAINDEFGNLYIGACGYE